MHLEPDDRSAVRQGLPYDTFCGRRQARQTCNGHRHASVLALNPGSAHSILTWALRGPACRHDTALAQVTQRMVFAALLDSGRRERDQRLAHALRVVPLLRSVPSADLVALWKRLHEEHVPAGTVACRRGEPGDHLYIIKSGAAEVRLGLGPDGISVARLAAGDFFGEMALLISDGRRTADVVIAQDSVLWVLQRADFDVLIKRSVPLLRAVNTTLSERLAEMLAARESRAGATGPAHLRFGPYRVIQQIGAGGMAVVYSAIHESTRVPAAIKVIPLAWDRAQESRERLRQEATLMQRVSHPNVIRLLEFGEVDPQYGGGYYLAMENLPEALDRILSAQHPDPMPVANALRLAQSVAEGLDAVHSAGFIHRDVKPSNILLRADGTPVLTDFGLAKVVAEAAHAHRITAPSMIVGTPDYLSPEQIKSEFCDGRSDVYALGTVLYEMLAGYVPFAGRTPLDTIRAHLETPPPPLPPFVPAAASAVVKRAMHKQPDERYASAGEMALALAAALDEVERLVLLTERRRQTWRTPLAVRVPVRFASAVPAATPQPWAPAQPKDAAPTSAVGVPGLTLEWQPDDGSYVAVPFHVLDVSDGGLGIISPGDMPVGARVRLTMVIHKASAVPDAPASPGQLGHRGGAGQHPATHHLDGHVVYAVPIAPDTAGRSATSSSSTGARPSGMPGGATSARATLDGNELPSGVVIYRRGIAFDGGHSPLVAAIIQEAAGQLIEPE